MDYTEFFIKATGRDSPFKYQTRLAECDTWPDLLEAPTGAGKTAAIVLAWLWRRRFAPKHFRDQTPRRLVYCLPMRVLVEQTRDEARKWLSNLSLHSDDIEVYVLMGGEKQKDWDLYPERDAILIGTQDMLLSRALNRGYGMSRYRWPMSFGLLNNDCQWVLDEVQLMGNGLATTAQVAAFHQRLGTLGNTRCLWVSATIQPDWLATVDFTEHVPDLTVHRLSAGEWTRGALRPRLTAAKPLYQTIAAAGKPTEFVKEILREHQPSSLTLVVVNTVKSAQLLFAELQKATRVEEQRGKRPPKKLSIRPELILLHSHFRPVEREEKLRRVLAALPPQGRVVISTQVVEAGVDISACTLFTELAPWSSLVQRFGRCNRYGEFTASEARVYWMDLETSGKKNAAAPYDADQLDVARSELKKLKEVGPQALRDHVDQLPLKRKAKLYPYTVEHVLRRPDLLDLFDTTPDLSGNDIDVARYIREGEELDVQVFWRDISEDGPSPLTPAPTRRELCTAPVGKFKSIFLKAPRHYAYLWDPLAEQWFRVHAAQDIYPGQVFLIPADMGGYSADLGWEASLTERVEPMDLTVEDALSQDATGRDLYLTGGWQTVAEHTDEVVREVRIILNALGALLTAEQQEAVLTAARWHDWGKAHEVFQAALTGKHPADRNLSLGEAWAKAPTRDTHYARPAFRHELASALGMVAAGKPDLACYLAAAHHGKVRLAIRSLPDEKRPPEPERRFARGIWDGDPLPVTQLGDGETTPAITIPLSLMELGRSPDGKPSWAERILTLREALGPFRLAYLEMLLRAADMRASAVHSLQEVPNA